MELSDKIEQEKGIGDKVNGLDHGILVGAPKKAKKGNATFYVLTAAAVVIGAAIIYGPKIYERMTRQAPEYSAKLAAPPEMVK